MNSREFQEIRKVLNAADGFRWKMKMKKMLNKTKLLKSLKTARVGECRRTASRILLSWDPVLRLRNQSRWHLVLVSW